MAPARNVSTTSRLRRREYHIQAAPIATASIDVANTGPATSPAYRRTASTGPEPPSVSHRRMGSGIGVPAGVTYCAGPPPESSSTSAYAMRPTWSRAPGTNRALASSNAAAATATAAAHTRGAPDPTIATPTRAGRRGVPASGWPSSRAATCAAMPAATASPSTSSAVRRKKMTPAITGGARAMTATTDGGADSGSMPTRLSQSRARWTAANACAAIVGTRFYAGGPVTSWVIIRRRVWLRPRRFVAASCMAGLGALAAASAAAGVDGAWVPAGPMPAGLDAPVFALAADPSGGGLLLAGTETGAVLRSTDGGASWAATRPGLGRGVAALAFDPDHP